jgi:hypothetical protein
VANLEDIAASLIVNAPSNPTKSAGSDAQDDNHDGSEDDAPQIADDNNQDDTAIEDQSDLNEEFNNDDEDAGEDSDPSDDGADNFTFKVDGEEVTVSAQDLIKSYSFDGAAQKRLQEATEARKTAAETGRTEGMREAQVLIESQTQEINESRKQLSQLVGLVGGELFAPQVAQPNPELQISDPIGYLTQMEAWRSDQGRISQMQQQIVNATQGQNDQAAQKREQVQEQQRVALTQKRPELRQPEEAKAFTNNVRTAQEKFGFTAEEVNNFPDHRALLLLEYVGKQMAQFEGEGQLTPAQRVVEKARRKPMAPSSAAVSYQRSTKQKQARSNRERAQKTGSVQDVARTLIQSAPQKR